MSEPTHRPIVTDGRCPACGSYQFSDVPGVWRRAICRACEQVYIRLTGCEAFRFAASNPADGRAVVTPVPLSPTWPHVLAFAGVMESKLAKNRHKGDRRGWLAPDLTTLRKLLSRELHELDEAIDGGDSQAVAEEAADVANFSMMIADKIANKAALGRRTPTDEFTEIVLPESDLQQW